MKFFVAFKRARLRRRITAQGNLINRADRDLEDWWHEARSTNRCAHSVRLQALLDHEYREKQTKIETLETKLDTLVERYEHENL